MWFLLKTSSEPGDVFGSRPLENLFPRLCEWGCFCPLGASLPGTLLRVLVCSHVTGYDHCSHHSPWPALAPGLASAAVLVLSS